MRYSCTPSRHIQAKAARKQKCKMPAMMEHTSWQRGQAETLGFGLGARVRLSFLDSQNDISPSWTYFKIFKLKWRFSSNQYFWQKSDYMECERGLLTFFSSSPSTTFWFLQRTIHWVDLWCRAEWSGAEEKQDKKNPQTKKLIRCISGLRAKSQVNIFQYSVFLVRMPSFHGAFSQIVFPRSCSVCKVTKGGIS